MKGVSCTRGGHNGEQLANMCLAISEDVHNSLMSKNNSNNDAAADCINNNKEDRGPLLDPAEHKRRAQAVGLVGVEGELRSASFSGDQRALLSFKG